MKTKRSLRNKTAPFQIYSILAALVFLFFGKIFFTASTHIITIIYGVCAALSIFTLFFVRYTFYKDPYIVAKKKNVKKKDYFISCIIAVKNEESIIKDCIDSFLEQTYKNREIIVIDDASTDKTSQILKRYEAKKKITLISLTENVGKKKALAKGILLSKGDIIAFSDSDSVFSPDVLEKAVMIFSSDQTIGAISGHCRALNADTNLLTKIQDSWYEGQFSVRKAFESVFGAVTCVSGPLAIFRRAAIYNYIPAWEQDIFLGQEFLFATDRTLTGFVLGSKYVGKDLKEKYKSSPFITNHSYRTREWKVVYSQAMRAWTYIPETLGKVLKQQTRWKKSFIRNIFFTGTFYWRKPFVASLLYYLHIGLVIFGPIIIIRHITYLAVDKNVFNVVLYILGIVFVGLLFGLSFRIENPHDSKWKYRPLMSLFSAFVLSWLIFYSAFTIRRKIWARG